MGMDPQAAVDLVRLATWMTMIIGAPLLGIGMLVGLLISLLQAVTQMQDQTLSSVPKLMAMALALVVCLPWLTDRMVEYTRDLWVQIPQLIAG
jgi:flagellar biosynthetic protein FliQ